MEAFWERLDQAGKSVIDFNFHMTLCSADAVLCAVAKVVLAACRLKLYHLYGFSVKDEELLRLLKR
jgi:hypothetical protein